jgi:hypothetical protein
LTSLSFFVGSFFVGETDFISPFAVELARRPAPVVATAAFDRSVPSIKP